MCSQSCMYRKLFPHLKETRGRDEVVLNSCQNMYVFKSHSTVAMMKRASQLIYIVYLVLHSEKDKATAKN